MILADKYIPKVTIKSEFQPPWFDCDVDRLCKKKERLRGKFKVTQNSKDYSKFSACRKELKLTIKEKMRINIIDDSDPALISKKLC